MLYHFIDLNIIPLNCVLLNLDHTPTCRTPKCKPNTLTLPYPTPYTLPGTPVTSLTLVTVNTT